MDYAAGAFEMPIRTVLSGKFLVMTAHHRPTRSAMVKTLRLNFESRVPSILGTVAWSNLDTYKHVVADAGAVTVIIGAGAQGVDQARAVHAVRPLTELEIVDADLARAETVCELLVDEFGPSVTLCASSNSRTAEEGKDIVCCATTVFKSVGAAIQDWAIADALARLDVPATASPARLEAA